MSTAELHRYNPTTRFSDRTDDYVRWRPGYPCAAIDAVLDGFDRSSVVVADIGAGTGISSRLAADRLSQRGRVIAIEPNEAMRRAAVAHARVEWREGKAEATGLADASVDVVLCAQAFHWFEQVRALSEFRRVIRPGGRVALMWNDRDNSDALTAEYGRLVDAASDQHPAAYRGERPDALFASALFRNARELRFPYSQRFPVEGLIGRALSASYVPKAGPQHDALIEALRALHHRFAGADGAADLVYVTRVFLADG